MKANHVRFLRTGWPFLVALMETTSIGAPVTKIELYKIITLAISSLMRLEAIMNKCKDCRFFVPHAHANDDPEAKGECHRNPPQWTGNGQPAARFPQVEPEQQPCGEFKALQE